jgi:acyl-CoA synthetase (AMP-forming)/AMP-acid ligase II
MLTTATRDHVATLFDARALLSSDSDPEDGSAPAIVYIHDDEAVQIVTRTDFRREVGRCAAALRALAVAPRQLVIVAHTQNLDSIYAFWGALLMGAIPSMFPTLTDKLDPTIYMGSMAELARLSDAAAVLTTDSFAPVLRSVVASCPVYSASDLGAVAGRSGEVNATRNPKFTAEVNATPTFSQLYPNHPDQIAFLQHSSGTTGLQKGVALSHRAVLNQIAAYADALDLRESDRIVSWLPLYHDMGLIAAFVQPLVQGIPLILMSPFAWAAHPTMLLRAIDAHRPTLCWLPNFAYNHMASRVRARDSEGLDLSSIRAFVNCSEPVRHDSHARFVTRFAPNGVSWGQMAVSYAMAENTFAVTQTRVGVPARVAWIDRDALQSERRAAPSKPGEGIAQVSCGLPIRGTAVKVVGDDGAALPERQVGELFVRSDCMLTAYYKRPDLQPFDADGWYKTGDRGFMADGEIYVIGRSKDLIIHAGKNIFPQDIEAVVNTVAGVHPGRAVAFGVPDAKEGTELIAVIAETDAATPDERKRISVEIRKRIGAQTDVTVSYVELVERGWLIKTSSGKIARGENRRKWMDIKNVRQE